MAKICKSHAWSHPGDILHFHKNYIYQPLKFTFNPLIFLPNQLISKQNNKHVQNKVSSNESAFFYAIIKHVKGPTAEQ